MFLAAGCCLSHVLAVGEALTEVNVTTDKSVDTTSRETLVRDLCKPGMTDEQKVLALFNWFERTVYHRPTPGDVNQNQHKVINVYGGVVCGTQGCQMADLCRAAGFEARVVCDAGGGHTYFEVKYGDAWHGFDTMDRFYVYTRGEPRQVASFAAIDKDPSLVKDAVKENRACPGMCFHGDDPMGFVSSKHRTLDYQPTAIPGLANLSLVPGERITWYWYNINKIHPNVKNGQGFAHSCAIGTDKQNPVNYPFWAPYFYDTPGCAPEQNKRRMYANGAIVLEPDLSRKALPPAFTELTNLAGPGLVPVEPGKPGIAVINIHSPYVLVSGSLTLVPAAGADLSSVEIATTKDGKTFAPVTGKPDGQGVLDLTPAVVAGFNYDFGVKLTLPDAKAAISACRLELVFMHNKYARPYLVAGENTVKFSAKNPELLAANPVTVEYAWQEGPAWDQNPVKKDVHAVKDAASSEWKINVGGGTFPRMKTLTIAGGAWNPDNIKALTIASVAGNPDTAQKPAGTAKTLRIPLKYVQYVSVKGTVAPTGRLQWPKNDADAAGKTAGAVLLTGSFTEIPSKNLAAARLVVPFVKASMMAQCKVGVVLLTTPVEAGKALDVTGLVDIKGTGVLPKLPEDKDRFEPPEVLSIDLTSEVKGIAGDSSKVKGFALRLVPDRAIDDGYAVGCFVAEKEPIYLEVDVNE